LAAPAAMVLIPALVALAGSSPRITPTGTLVFVLPVATKRNLSADAKAAA